MLAGGKQGQATFIISLDFELHWGVRDVKTVDQYRDNLVGVRKAVPAILELFAEHEIHATWATVGFLFFSRKHELLNALPTERPDYDDPRLSPYPEIDGIGEDEEIDPFHFGRRLLEQIQSTPNQEIGTHTFSHYYCLERKKNLAAFRADLTAACAAARKFGIVLRSIVFPRNQYDQEHLRVCRELGLTAFRGNPESWLYRSRSGREQSGFLRATRLLDSYWNLLSHNCYPLLPAEGGLPTDTPTNLPASRFLRPYSPRLRVAQTLQERRIESDLTYAAQRGLTYHLWWHPHNFGANLDRNVGTLRRILDHYGALRQRYRMASRNMAECIVMQAAVQEHLVEDDRFARPRR